MNDQNIYDNPSFFEGYRKLRNNPSAANDIVEKPALFSLCPDFFNKAVLDLGCGYGENCRDFSKMGAERVLGVDISEKMLDIAKKENQSEIVSFMRMSMSDISFLNMKFDVILSSLAVHYIENFDKLVADIYTLLNEDGIFIFSQEHPLTTALTKEPRWSRDSNGNILHYNLTDYSIPGERITTWIIDGVIKYHRSFSSILNSLSTVGFIIERVLEPLPDNDIIQKYPSYKKYYHKPDFLLIRARKDRRIK
ncbi:MAG: class I SAM-dependent methyltransferase [Clostridia bacterium]